MRIRANARVGVRKATDATTIDVWLSRRYISVTLRIVLTSTPQIGQTTDASQFRIPCAEYPSLPDSPRGLTPRAVLRAPLRAAADRLGSHRRARTAARCGVPRARAPQP